MAEVKTLAVFSSVLCGLTLIISSITQYFARLYTSSFKIEVSSFALYFDLRIPSCHTG